MMKTLIISLLFASVVEVVSQAAETTEQRRKDNELTSLLSLNCRDKEQERTFQTVLESTSFATLKRAEVLVLYARCLLHTKQRAGEAISLLKEAVQILPTNAGVYRHLGAAFFRLGKDLDAIEAYERSLELASDAYTYAQLGIAYMRSVSGPLARSNPESFRQSMARSEENFRQALHLSPGNPVFHNQLGSCLILQGKREEGISEIQHAIDLTPSFKEWQSDTHQSFALADFYFSLGQVHWQSGKKVEGERLMNQAIEKVPNERVRKHLTLLGNMTMGRIPPSRRKAELGAIEDAMRKNIFDPYEEETINAH